MKSDGILKAVRFDNNNLEVESKPFFEQTIKWYNPYTWFNFHRYKKLKGFKGTLTAKIERKNDMEINNQEIELRSQTPDGQILIIKAFIFENYIEEKT